MKKTYSSHNQRSWTKSGPFSDNIKKFLQDIPHAVNRDEGGLYEFRLAETKHVATVGRDGWRLKTHEKLWYPEYRITVEVRLPNEQERRALTQIDAITAEIPALEDHFRGLQFWIITVHRLGGIYDLGLGRFETTSCSDKGVMIARLHDIVLGSKILSSPRIQRRTIRDTANMAQ